MNSGFFLSLDVCRVSSKLGEKFCTQVQEQTFIPSPLQPFMEVFRGKMPVEIV